MTRRTRRAFLSDSVLAAAVAAAFPAGSLLGAEKKKGDKPKKNPGDLLQAAVVGVGGRGRGHLSELMNNPNAEIAYIVDTDEKIGQQRVEAVAKQQGRAPKFVRDMRQAFDDKSVNIVTTATPNHWHALCAIWAMKAGKDVYVEKPVCYNVSEGRRMVETARKYGRVCQAGTQCRSMKGTIDAIAYVKAGKIGRVTVARGLCYKRRNSIGPKGNYEVPPEVDYNLWCGPARMLPLTRQKFHYDWHWQREWGNGDMGNQGPHQMDIARWGLGVDRLADSAIAYGGRLGYEDAGAVALATHPDHASAPPDIRRYVRYGASPRGAQAMILGGKVRALGRGRYNVALEDVRALAPAALRHRIILSFEGEAAGVDPDTLVANVLTHVPEPQG